MKILDHQQNTPAWLQARIGVITGSKLKGLIVKRGTAKKIGFYELLAEKICMKEDYQDPMERGHALEDEAVKLFEDKTGYIVDQVGLCISEENPDIALSPDGLIKGERSDNFWGAVEVKCLSSAKHLKAYFEKEIPKEYEEQATQYFIVNEHLEMLYFTFYDPRVTCLPIHYLEIKREDYEDKIELYKQYQLGVLAEIKLLSNKLTF